MTETRWWRREPPASARRSRAIRTMNEDMVRRSGTSTHSASATTLPLVLERLEEARVPYSLFAHPGRGYFVQSHPEIRGSDLRLYTVVVLYPERLWDDGRPLTYCAFVRAVSAIAAVRDGRREAWSKQPPKSRGKLEDWQPLVALAGPHPRLAWPS